MPCPTAVTSRMWRRSIPLSRCSTAFSPDRPGRARPGGYLSTMLRLTPFDLVFSQLTERAFPEIRASIERAGYNPTDRDAFLMIPEVVTLLRELRPEEGVGDVIVQLGPPVHHAYVLWAAGWFALPVAVGFLP